MQTTSASTTFSKYLSTFKIFMWYMYISRIFHRLWSTITKTTLFLKTHFDGEDHR